MTEQEFMKQVWRPYDTVTTENGIKGRVNNVCFPTKSVRVMMPDGMPEWFRCGMIAEHKSVTCDPNDIALIEDLHNQLMGAQDRISKLEEEKERLTEGLKKTSMGAITTNVNTILSQLHEKKRRIERMEACMDALNELIERLSHNIEH